jgi:pimeloyl-ACP methyl ester carboxylesterase
MLSNGTDVIHSVPAARAAVPNLSEKWIVIGHSQGGLSTLGVAQLESTLRDPSFLGTVALAGASDLEDGIDAVFLVDQPVLNGLLAFMVFGMKTVYPQLDVKDVLTDTAIARYDAFVEDGCSAASGAFNALPTKQMFKPGWKENQFIKRFLTRDRPGAQPVRGPLLLVTGGSDVMFTESAGRKIFQRLCAGGQHIQWNVYPGLGHDPVVYGSLKDQLGWLAARFRGEPAPSNCVVD